MVSNRTQPYFSSFTKNWLLLFSGCAPKYLLTDKSSPQESPTSPDSGISSASSTEDNSAKKELNFESDTKETSSVFTFPKSKPPKIKKEPQSETCTTTAPAAKLPEHSMPSIITATAAVAVANSVMSGNVVSSSKQLSSSQESLAGDLVEPSVKREPIDGGEEDEYSEEDDADSEMSSDEMCLEAKEVINYTSDESNSDEDDFRKDEDDSDYGDKKGNLDKRHHVSRSWGGPAVPPRLSLQLFFYNPVLTTTGHFSVTRLVIICIICIESLNNSRGDGSEIVT